MSPILVNIITYGLTTLLFGIGFYALKSFIKDTASMILLEYNKKNDEQFDKIYKELKNLRQRMDLRFYDVESKIEKRLVIRR